MKLTQTDHQTWQILFSRQVPNIHRFACQEFVDGFMQLGLPADHIPSLEWLNKKIHPASGWAIVRTPVRYLSDEQWAEHIHLKKFPITNFLRTRDELDFTPEPDVFHDIFGHLPMLMNPKLLKILNIFSQFYAQAPTAQLPALAQLWWNTIEFGLIQQNKKTKVFGAGLMSSFSEIENAVSKKTDKIPFNFERGISKPRAVNSFHSAFLRIRSLDELQSEILDFSSLLKNQGAL